MPDLPSSAVTVTWAGGTVTLAIHGELDPIAAAEVRERIATVAGSGPQRLVLELAGLGDRFDAETLALIAVARHLLPPGCVLDIRSASPAVRRILALAGWSGLTSTGDEQPESGRDGP